MSLTFRKRFCNILVIVSTLLTYIAFYECSKSDIVMIIIMEVLCILTGTIWIIKGDYESSRNFY